MSVPNTLEQKLKELKLGRMREVVTSWITQAEQQQLGYGEFLDELLSEELLGRQENQIRRKLKAAGFPYAAGSLKAPSNTGRGRCRIASVQVSI